MNPQAPARPVLLWAPQAWIDGRWQAAVTLEVDARGCWSRIETASACPPAATRLAGPALPGLVDAHGHAFQRAHAGLAERRVGAHDDFWSWRDRMYRVAGAIDAAALRAIAAHLYAELLAGGYTQVCEFHYLHRARDGTQAADPLAYPMALAQAALDAGIGLTFLPVLYERAGFEAAALREDQRRFQADADAVWRQSIAFEHGVAGLGENARALLSSGLAVHSLRAAAPASIARLLALAAQAPGPLHIHVAEQRAEVDACRAATGTTPVDWLARQGWLDARWHLVHATHVTAAEIEAVAAAGAGVVLCPSTEANLGDGFAPLPAWLDAGVTLSLGSDSHVTRCWREELRWLEYGQRLRLERRNVAARPVEIDDAPEAGTAANLYERLRAGGGRAAGQAQWGFVPGARADLLVGDPDDGALSGLPPGRWLDAWVFSSPTRPWRDVLVAGRWTVREGRHLRGPRLAQDFADAMAGLWQER